MVPTAPVEVLFLLVLFAALLASLEPAVKLALPLNELLDSDLGLFFLSAELLHHSLQVEYLVFVITLFFSQLGDALNIGSFTFFVRLSIRIKSKLNLLLPFERFLKLQSKLVSFLNHL